MMSEIPTNHFSTTPDKVTTEGAAKMNQTQLAQLRLAVDFQIASWEVIALLSHELGTSLDELWETAFGLAVVHDRGSDVSRQAAVGTLNHIRTLRRECTPPTVRFDQDE
jgi:hypothetical protein